MSFWNSVPSYPPRSMSAIFLSDTADKRGYMKACYHQNCDDIDHVTLESLQFLAQTSEAIVKTANDWTELSCSVVTRVSTSG